jgi:hypothetical protein
MPVVVAILTTTVLGIPVTLLIDRNARGPILVGLSYLYGTAVIYFVELALALLGVRWTLFDVNLLTIIVSAACYVAKGKGSVAAGSGASVERRWRWSVVDLATVIMVAAFTSFATIARMWEWDFWAIWGLKARTFFEFGTIDWRFLQSPWNDFAHPDYPLLVPFNYVYASLTAGVWSDRWIGFITVAFGVALILIVRGLASMETTPNLAAAIAFASTVFALSRFVGLAEGPMSACAGAGLLFLRRAFLYDDSQAMRHGALLIGLAAAVKDEGSALLMTVVIAVALVNRRSLLRLWPAFAVALPWIVIRALHRYQSPFMRGDFTGRVAHRISHPAEMTALLFHYLNSRWMWLGIVVALFVVPFSMLVRERFVLLAFALQIGAYVAVYFGTPYGVEWHIATSWSRVPNHVATPLLYVVMLMLARTYDSAHAEARPEQQ